MPRNKDYPNTQLSCSFCGKGQREVRKLIAGPTVYICDECIRLCTDIIDEEVDRKKIATAPKATPKPEEIKAFLDAYIIGQDHAKKVLAVAVYNHYKRVDGCANKADIQTNSDPSQDEHASQDLSADAKNRSRSASQSNGQKGKQAAGQKNQRSMQAKSATTDADAIELTKSNVLLVGPTGTGKTLLARTLAKMLDVPFTIADATTLTEAGYVGEDAENIVANLLVAADNDVERAQRGIIYIDEIDKIARKGDSPSMTRDVSGEGVQQALLKIIEGTQTNITSRGNKKYGQSDSVQVDTSNILIICGGSFTGIEHVIRGRQGAQSMGFGAEVKGPDKRSLGELLRTLEPEDLTKYGLIPEFVGRMPVVATLENLETDNLVKILTEPRNALIRQYQKLFSLEGVDLEFDENAVREIADQAIRNKSGARGLRAVLENAMLEIMYEVPFLENLERCHITKEIIQNGGGEPRLTYRTKKSA